MSTARQEIVRRLAEIQGRIQAVMRGDDGTKQLKGVLDDLDEAGRVFSGMLPPEPEPELVKPEPPDYEWLALVAHNAGRASCGISPISLEEFRETTYCSLCLAQVEAVVKALLPKDEEEWDRITKPFYARKGTMSMRDEVDALWHRAKRGPQ